MPDLGEAPDDALPDCEDALDDAEWRANRLRELEQKHSSSGGPGLDARENQELNRLKTRRRIEEEELTRNFQQRQG